MVGHEWPRATAPGHHLLIMQFFLQNRKDFFRFLGRVVERVTIIRNIQACHDPKDDKFLELAVNGQAETIITGDEDLLALHPFRSVQIITPGRFLDQSP